MKIKIIADCYISGNLARVGDVVEIGENVGRQLIGMERAVPHKDEPKAPAQEPKKPEGKSRG